MFVVRHYPEENLAVVAAELQRAASSGKDKVEEFYVTQLALEKAQHLQSFVGSTPEQRQTALQQVQMCADSFGSLLEAHASAQAMVEQIPTLSARCALCVRRPLCCASPDGMGECQPCCAVLCCAVLCCAVLCCAVLCCSLLCCDILCCAVLCCAVLCCAVLCCAVPRLERLRPDLQRRPELLQDGQLSQGALESVIERRLQHLEHVIEGHFADVARRFDDVQRLAGG
jgi:hypothetical protein